MAPYVGKRYVFVEESYIFRLEVTGWLLYGAGLISGVCAAIVGYTLFG